VMPSTMKWALAYYKLNALHFLAREPQHEAVALLDCDTVTIDGFSEVWEECQDWLLLYSVGHRFSHPQRQTVIANHARVFQGTGRIEHFGGEFIAGSHALLNEFVGRCEEIHSTLLGKLELYDDRGDEQIISEAGHLMRDRVLTANRYTERYWTGSSFRRVTTHWRYDKVAVMHLPAEKRYGLAAAYAYLNRRGRLPGHRTLVRMMGLNTLLEGKARHGLRILLNLGLARMWRK
jgi:hypothetical protein